MNITNQSIKSGLRKLDEMTKGFHATDLTLFCMNPHSDPAHFIVSCILNAIRDSNGKALYFCFDWRGASIRRCIAESNETEKQKLFENMKILDCEFEYEIEELISESTNNVQNNGFNIIFIDCLQMIGTRNEDYKRFESTSEIKSRIKYVLEKLKKLVSDLMVPVVCVNPYYRDQEDFELAIENMRKTSLDITDENIDIAVCFKRENTGGKYGRMHSSKVMKNKYGPAGIVPALYSFGMLDVHEEVR